MHDNIMVLLLFLSPYIVRLVFGSSAILEKYGLPTANNFLAPFIEAPSHSSVQTYEQFAIPDSNIWSICAYCGWTRRGVVLYQRNASTFHGVHSTVLSSGLWQEFFTSSNDKVDVYNIKFHRSRSYSHYEVASPVFLLPMITFHPGHMCWKECIMQ